MPNPYDMNPYNPYLQPYQQQTQQQMQQSQQNNMGFPAGMAAYQQSQQPPVQRPAIQQGFSGRIVENPAEIKASEVPMDGSTSLFLKSDYTRIYAKAWDANGNIQTIEYVPYIPAELSSSDSNVDNSTAMILERLESIEKKLDKRPYYGGNKKYNKPYNKESHKEEQS